MFYGARFTVNADRLRCASRAAAGVPMTEAMLNVAEINNYAPLKPPLQVSSVSVSNPSPAIVSRSNMPGKATSKLRRNMRRGRKNPLSDVFLLSSHRKARPGRYSVASNWIIGIE